MPCIRCNERIKFRDLLSAARDLGAEVLATGHYARRVEGPQGPELHAAADTARDQSYFLFATTAGQLEYLRFPLGSMAKAETRFHATRLGLAVAGKPDSQDICFVAGGNYADIVRSLRPEAARPGDIVDRDGRVLGRHQGIINFTVGQRRGLNIGGGGALYVLRLEPDTAQLIVGPKEALGQTSVIVKDVNWLGGGEAAAPGTELEVKIRSLAPSITALGEGRAAIELAAPAAGVAPGQACVFYQGTRVLGGGWITREPALSAGDGATRLGALDLTRADA